ncbi:MAG: CoA transferase [Dehalococcoidia bacterium]|nr:CoA transferase [Dehalococcoidia bacterium]MDW8120516.1 CaiB/BaiF CoA-transferase family protein [Chloroflexota bacterium]
MPLPLEGYRVIDLSRLAPGPFCTMVLADLGADVLRVEEPGGGRRTRMERDLGGADAQAQRRQVAFNALHRGKRSIALNLKHPEAQRILHRLVERADVFVEGFRPGVVKRLACDYDTLKAVNPRLVYCSLSGYGQDGPYAGLVGHDINYISIGGALGIIGPQGGPPAIPYNLLADYAGGGLLAALAIVVALLHRERTGQGQYIDIAMTDGVLYLLAAVVSEYLLVGKVPEPGTMRLNGGVPYYNVYPCKDGRYISIGCIEPWFWENLCRALGREDFIPHQHNEATYPDIFSAFRQIFLTRTRDEWWAYLRSQGDIAVAPVYTLDEVMRDPQVRHRQMMVEVGQVNGETVRQVGIAPKFSATPGRIRSLGASPGQHTAQVLAELGYTSQQVQSLREQGAIE